MVLIEGSRSMRVGSYFGWGGLIKCLMEGGDKIFMPTGMAGEGAVDFTPA